MRLPYFAGFALLLGFIGLAVEYYGAAPVYDTGLMQFSNPAESSEQAKVAPVDVEVKLN